MTFSNQIEKVVKDIGPSRAGRVVEKLASNLNISVQAARKRLSRARAETLCRVRHLLPKREVFFYVKSQWRGVKFWSNLMRDLRETNSTYAHAIDGIIARGGIVPVEDFGIVSGAPLVLKRQLCSDHVAQRLIEIHAIHEETIDRVGLCYVVDSRIAGSLTRKLTKQRFHSLRIVETLGLESLREWVGRNSVGAFNQLITRGDESVPQVGQFNWDLSAPSYLRPIRSFSSTSQSGVDPGFVVADSFMTQFLDVNHIRYFIHKIKIYEQTSNSGKLFPILLSNSFSKQALKVGRGEGIMMVTSENLFGPKVAAALQDLVSVLQDVSAAIKDEERMRTLVDSLAAIDGRNGNMRGILFELIVAAIVQHKWGAQGIEHRVSHSHRCNSQSTDLDILFRKEGNAVHIIECKGKSPGGKVKVDEVEDWLSKIPIMRDYLDSRPDLKKFKAVFEFWTSGCFMEEAKELITNEKSRRRRNPIDYRDGEDVRELASNAQLGAMVDALNEHYLKHPIRRIVRQFSKLGQLHRSDGPSEN